MERTENMQAYVDNLVRRIELHGKGQNGEDQRMKIMIKAVEEPGYLKCTDEQSVLHWKEFAKEQMEYGRAAVADITKNAPHLLNDDIIGSVIKAIMGGWEYGERFMRLLEERAVE